MKGKKVLAMMLALSMVLGLVLTGCSTESNQDAPADQAEVSKAKKSGDEAAKSESESDKNYNITLITMDQMDTYWASMDKGAKDAIAELEGEGYTINYNWYAPDTKDNAKQIEQIGMAASNKSDVILIAVNDPTACNSALQAAADSGSKIIYVDAAATFASEATFSTDNYAAGQEAARQMLKTLEKEGITEGQIGIVSAQTGVESCTNRIDGFCNVIEESNFTTSEVQYSDGDTSKAQELSTNLINNGAVALFGVTGQASVGCGNAARDAQTKIPCIGFDTTSTVLTLVESEVIQAVIAHDPHAMGYQGMKAAAEIMGGKSYGGAIEDTGIQVVTLDNVADFKE